MKSKCVIIFVILFCIQQTNLLSQKTVILKQKNGFNTPFVLSDVRKITFTSGNLNVIKRDVTTKSVALTDVRSIPMAYVVSVNTNADVTSLNPSQVNDIYVSNGNTLTLNSTVDVKSIIVSPGSKLNLNTGQTLTAKDGITLQSDVTGTATFVDANNDAPQAVSGTVQQYITAQRNWYTTSPVEAGTAAVMNLGTSVQTYTESAKTWSVLNSGDALIAGKGYVSVATTGTGTTGTVSFTGILNTGTITVPVTRTGTDKAGFNLVANPYPSYLDWSLVVADPLNANIGTTMWFRTKTAGNLYTFSTYNSVGNVAVANGANTTITKFIPPMQAFWIRVNNGTASTNLTFKNTMRAHKDGNGNTLKAPRLDNQQLVRLQVSNGTCSDEAVVYFNSDALDGYDKYDSPKMFESTTVMKPEIYTQVGTEKLVINGMAELKYNTEITLGFTTSQKNSFCIKTSEFKNFEVGTKLILLDKSTNPTSEFELNEGANYNFSSDITSSSADRFSILFRAPVVSTGVDTTPQLNARVIVNANNQIAIIDAEKCNYTIYNAMGQQIENGILNYKSNTIHSKLMQGVYVVRVSGNGKEITTKVILK